MSNTGSRLAGCPAQFVNLLTRLQGLLKGLQPCVGALSEHQGRLFFQMLIVQLHTYMEAYFKCMVTQAAMWDPDAARDYLCKRRPEQADNIPGLPVSALYSWLKAEVAFGDGASGLKGVMKAMFDIDVFPDLETESKCLDLVNVRNVCVHELGMVEAKHSQLIKTPGVVVPAGRVGQSQLYRLEVSPEFFIACAEAITMTVQHLKSKTDSDKRYSHEDDETISGLPPKSSSGRQE